MNDGGYSRIEKDFLGNERMVHYDGSGNMIGASDVVREPDGTIRIPNETAHAGAAGDLPDIQVIEPTPKMESASHIPNDAGKVMAGKSSQMPMSQTVTYVIATFVAAMLLTLGALAVIRSRGGSGGASQDFRSTSVTQPTPRFNQQAEPLPERAPDQYPADPKPRNDEQPTDAQPYDQSAPDMNSGDSNRPKIEPDPNQQTEPEPDKDPKKGTGDDPIDLRGDGEPQKDPPKTDPNDIH